MTEFSYWWTTSGTPTGDQVASYTQAHLATISEILASCSGFEGVSPTMTNLLGGTVTGANTVQINTGAAVVDGKPYENDAAVNVNIPSAVGGGNTRIDRIVVRASWSGFTARITRIAGTDAASPTAPAITQTSGSTYDIKLYQALVDTSGAVTLTDERDWARPSVDGTTVEWNVDTLRVKSSGINTTQIADNAVTNAKMADNSIDTAEIVNLAVTSGKIANSAVGTTQIANDAVDDTKVGNRVPQLYRRQGGHPTNWATQGSTNYTPGMVRMQAGVKRVSMGVGVSTALVSVTFPVGFSVNPMIVHAVNTTSVADMLSVAFKNIFTTSFEIYMARSDTTFSHEFDVMWLAIGPE